MADFTLNIYRSIESSSLFSWQLNIFKIAHLVENKYNDFNANK